MIRQGDERRAYNGRLMRCSSDNAPASELQALVSNDNHHHLHHCTTTELISNLYLYQIVILIYRVPYYRFKFYPSCSILPSDVYYTLLLLLDQ